jgi:hypothetical protein
MPTQATLIDSLFPAELDPKPGRRARRLLAEAIVVTLVSSLLPIAMGVPEGGLIALFLISASQSGRLAQLLEENRNAIYVTHTPSSLANRRTVVGIFWIFAGILVGFALVAIGLGEQEVSRFFGFTIRAAELGEGGLRGRMLGSAGSILAHNTAVTLVIVGICFIYQSYGAMLVLGWNACVWSFVLTVLVARDLGTESSAAAAAMVSLAVLPHLAAEALAYIMASLGAIYASRALARHPLGGSIQREVLRVTLSLFAFSLVALVVAALLEAWVAGPLLTLL